MPVFKPITLSKSRFKLALECPRKLDYARGGYYNAADHDPMMKALAEGGHKVGELARQMFPGGILISDCRGTTQAEKTKALLKQRNVTIYEATIQHGNLLIRVDVLKKEGNRISLIEVKAKGFNPDDPKKGRLRTQKKGINPIVSDWRPYLYDIAYQDYVFRKAFPRFETTPYLMLLDKRQRVNFDGLNGMIQVQPDGSVPPVVVSTQFDVTRLIPSILQLIDVTQEVKALQDYPVEAPGLPESFPAVIDTISDRLEQGTSFPVLVGPRCKGCQFYVDPKEWSDKGHSGWHKCLTFAGSIDKWTRRQDTAFGLYKVSDKQLSGYFEDDKPIELSKVDPLPRRDTDKSDEQITEGFRRHLQIKEAHGKLKGPYILKRPLKAALGSFKGPLHFLDFETARPALPWHRRRRPYEQILFQFSHHVLHPSGKLEHRSQCLKVDPGQSPTLEVLRELKAALSGDAGRVIHWSPYEGSVLNTLPEQIDFDKPRDARDLKTFIHELLGTKAGSGRLFDLCKLVRETVFYPGSSGSSSIKQVLPAVLRTSGYVREHYGQAVYGTEDMPSLNFRDWTWIQPDHGGMKDPYKLLDPALHGGKPDADYVADGGAAQIAYDRLQDTMLSAAERTAIKNQLLRYCELDTLAMVMVYQSLLEG